MGSGIKGKGGTALIYRSTDLMQGWELEGTLCEGTIEDSGVVWECPRLVPLLPVPSHQRSRHPHIPPPWLHQPNKLSSSKSSITLRESSSPFGKSNSQLKEEKEKHGGGGGGVAAAADGIGTTSSLGGGAAGGSRFTRRVGGFLSPSSSASSPALLGTSNSKEGSPSVKTAGGGGAVSAAAK